jgi:hypothetical protein
MFPGHLRRISSSLNFNVEEEVAASVTMLVAARCAQGAAAGLRCPPPYGW